MSCIMLQCTFAFYVTNFFYHSNLISTTASDSLNFDILLGQFLYLVSFIICIFLNCVTNQTFSRLYLLFNVRNIFFTYFYLVAYLVLVITYIWYYLTKCGALSVDLSKPFDSLLYDSLLTKLNTNWFEEANADK